MTELENVAVLVDSWHGQYMLRHLVESYQTEGFTDADIAEIVKDDPDPDTINSFYDLVLSGAITVLLDGDKYKVFVQPDTGDWLGIPEKFYELLDAEAGF